MQHLRISKGIKRCNLKGVIQLIKVKIVKEFNLLFYNKGQIRLIRAHLKLQFNAVVVNELAKQVTTVAK